MQDWALATTLPNAERRVSEELLDGKVPHRLFKRKTRVVRRGQVYDCVVPAFPRYIFIPLLRCWEIVSRFRRLTGVVVFGGSPAAVSESRLQEIGCVDDVLVEEEAGSGFETGDAVSFFLSGHSSEMCGVYNRPFSRGRSLVLVSGMGRYVLVGVNDCDLRRSEPEVSRRVLRRMRQRSSRSHGDHCSRSHASP